MIAGDRTQRNVKKSSIPERTPSCSPRPVASLGPPGHSRPRLKHSRAGYSGNPWGMCLCAERLNFNFKFSFLAGAKYPCGT